MRLEENHENWLKFAYDYWEIDNGLSAIELGKDMIMKHVKKARDSAYGYTGELDEALAHADKVIEATDRDNLKDTVDSLCDLGEIDAVTKALKNVTLGTIMKSTGIKSTQTTGDGAKITAGGNKSPVRYNGATMKRSPVKSFNDVVDAPTKAFNRVVSDSVNPTARSIMEATIARKTTDAAATLKTTPIGKGKEMNTQMYDNEETWTNYAKQEAAGRVKGDTVASKTVEIPSIRMDSFNDTRARIPFEFRGVNPSDAAVRLSQGVVDVVNPNGSAHGPINFNTDGTQPNTYRDEGKKTLPQYRGGKANNGEPQQFPREPTGDGGSNIESGRGYY
jgi:hypothetical protein